MIYRGPGGPMIWNLAPPFPPLSFQQVFSLSQSSGVSPVELSDGRGGREGVRRKLNHRYDHEKA
jgi:hypothetical protein